MSFERAIAAVYKRFYGLEEAPFNLTPDPRFLYLSQRHREAIAALMFGISEHKGFIVVTGEIGSGKTTICRALLAEFTSATRVALILNPSLTEIELLQAINQEFQVPSQSNSKKELIDHLNRFLLSQKRLGHTCLLIIDEAQNLPPDVLEQIRLISNLETETDKLIQIILMGQPELAETLARPELEQLNQRISVRYHITPLGVDEVSQYIRHRLFVAGAKVEIDIPPGALRLIFQHTRGIPRRINVLMDRVLLVGYVEGTYTLDESIVRRAVREIAGEAGPAGAHTPRFLGRARKSRHQWIRPTLAAAVAAAAVTLGAVVVRGQLPGLSEVATRGDTVNERSGAFQIPQLTDQVVPGQPGSNLPVPGPQDPLLTRPPLNYPPLEPTGESDSMESPRDWSYDRHNIVRVAGTEESWRAALMTLISIWSHQRYDLAPLALASPGQRQQIVESIFAALAGHGFKKADLTGSLNQMVRLDIPLILDLAAGTPPDGSAEVRLSPYVVLLGAEQGEAGETLTVADPVRGLVRIDRPRLSALYQGRAVAIYPDPYDLGSIRPGETSERVRSLQGTLAAEGYYVGAPSGTYDVATREAVRDFQRDQRLPPSGQIDAATALRLALASQGGNLKDEISMQ